MTFECFEMTEEDKLLVDRWQEEAEKLGYIYFLGLPKRRLSTSVSSSMAVDRERGFYFICYDPFKGGSKTYFFHLWWDGGLIEICSSMEKIKDEKNIDESDEIYHLNVYLMRLHQKKTSYTNEYLFDVVKEAFDAYELRGNDPIFGSYVGKFIVSLNNPGLSGDWKLFFRGDKKQTFEYVEMTEEDKRLVCLRSEESEKIGRDFFKNLISSHISDIVVDRKDGFYFIRSAVGNEESDPIYYFYLWWKGGNVEISSKREEKYEKNIQNDEKINKIYYLKYDIFDMYLRQNKTSYTKEYLFYVIKEALKAYESKYSDIKTLVVNLDNVQLRGDWATAFVGVEMTKEDKKLVNSWPEEARKLGRDFLEYRLWGNLTDSGTRMAVDRERGFYFINSAVESLGPEGPVINPTHFFYLWWNGGFIEISAKKEEKRRCIIEGGRNKNSIYYLKYDVFQMYVHQRKTSHTKEYLLNVVKEAFEAYKSHGNDPYYDSCIETLIVNLNKTKLCGRFWRFFSPWR